MEIGKFLSEFSDVDMFDEVKDFLMELCDKEELTEDEMDVDDNKGKPLFLVIRASAFKSLGMAWPSLAATQGMVEVDRSLG